MSDYVMVTTAQTDEKTHMLKEPGRINGGFYQRTDDPVSKYPSIVIAVKDLDASIEKVKDAGGTIHGEPYDIPNVGRYVSMIDTEGNRASLLQPKAR